MKHIIIPGLWSLLFLIASCTGSKPEVKEDKMEVKLDENTVELTQEQIKQAGIVIASPAQKKINQTLRLKGNIEAPPSHIAALSIPLGGYIKQMKLVPGMPVTKGAVLCRIEDPQYIELQQNYLVGKSRLSFLEDDYNRQAQLHESGSVSDKVFQQAKSEYTSQRAIVKGLDEKLRLIGIEPQSLTDATISRSIPLVSPITGQVSKVNVNAGQYAGPTDILFEITDPSDIHLSLTVFENDLAKLSPGQRVVCYSNSNPSIKYAAKIALINRSIDDERASEVHCHLETVNNKLVPGMFMNAEVELANASSPAVPDDAIVRWENQHYIFIAETNSRFIMTRVETGVSKDGFTAIATDTGDKKIVTANAYSLLMKLKNNAEE